MGKPTWRNSFGCSTASAFFVDLRFTASPVPVGKICHTQGDSSVLILSRKNDESIVIGGSGHAITITVVAIRNGRVRLGIEAPADVRVNRVEVCEPNSSEPRPTIHKSEPAA